MIKPKELLKSYMLGFSPNSYIGFFDTVSEILEELGNDWNTSEERRREIPRCVLPNGDILEWNERLELRVDPKTGITYPPGENQGFQLSRNNAGNAKS